MTEKSESDVASQSERDAVSIGASEDGRSESEKVRIVVRARAAAVFGDASFLYGRRSGFLGSIVRGMASVGGYDARCERWTEMERRDGRRGKMRKRGMEILERERDRERERENVNEGTE